MNTFSLKIVTPDGLIYDGQAESLLVRTTGGDISILAGHVSYVSPLGMGRAVVTAIGEKQTAACIGGMVSVIDGNVTLVPTTFEWAKDIDITRADASLNRANSVLNNKESSQTDIKLAEARLRRALIRKSVASSK